MCGINAIYAWHHAAPPADPEELIRTRDAMRARGPDAAGCWISPDRRLALGHRRLSILDLHERANQPMLAREVAIAVRGVASAFYGAVLGLNRPMSNHGVLRAAIGQPVD